MVGVACAGATVLAMVVGPAAGNAAAPPSVPCSSTALISALHTIDQSPTGAGTLSLAAGCTYTLDAVDNTTDGSNAFPVIHGPVTITGNGATFARAASTPPFRFFTVDVPGVLTLQGLTLRGGATPAGQLFGGGAILNLGATNVSGMTFTGNSAPAEVGGGALDDHNLGRLSVDASTFVGNSATQGGAVENEATYCDTSQAVCGSVTISGSTFRGNSTSAFGGGAVETAHARGQVGACPQPSPGLCEMPGGAVTNLQRDALVGNTAATDGGAVANYGSTTIASSTITGNTTNSDDDRFGGGGIQNTGVARVTSSTVAGNRSAFGANVHTYTDTVDGLPAPVTTFTSSIVAALGAAGSSCGGAVPLTDGGYNLDSGTTCGFSSSQHSLVDVDPKLASVGNHGGPTPTMPLSPHSPAIDVIPPTAAGCNGSVDQRGTPRPSGPGCDIGAFEVTLADRIAAAGVARPSARFVSVLRAHGVYPDTGVRAVRTSHGSGLLAVARGATTYITFSGSRLDLLFQGGPTAGVVRILVAGHAHVADLYSRSAATVRISLAVRRGVHLARVVALGTRDRRSHGKGVFLTEMRVH